VSVTIGVAIILLMYKGIAYTEGGMKQYSTCKDKIVEYEQRGMYLSGEDFVSALSFCG
jgi:hypothetical protein